MPQLSVLGTPFQLGVIKSTWVPLHGVLVEGRWYLPRKSTTSIVSITLHLPVVQTVRNKYSKKVRVQVLLPCSHLWAGDAVLDEAHWEHWTQITITAVSLYRFGRSNWRRPKAITRSRTQHPVPNAYLLRGIKPEKSIPLSSLPSSRALMHILYLRAEAGHKTESSESVLKELV